MPRTPSTRRQKDSEAKRGLVAEQLRLGHEAFARGDFDIALSSTGTERRSSIPMTQSRSN